jgi:hypothetical protein
VFDNIFIDQMTTEEIVAVFTCEIGHYQY